MAQSAIDVMSAALSQVGNPSSLHTHGRAARKSVEDAREKLARAIDCLPSEIIFTGSGTESDNAAIKGLFWKSNKKVIVTSAIEHPAVLEAALWLVEHEGAEHITIPVLKNGVIDLQFLQQLVDKRGIEIALISVMHANNETGVIQPLGDVVRIAGDIPVHTDAIQSFTKAPFSFKELGLHAATMSGHKVGGPLGIGILVLRRAYEIPALLHGGLQPARRRGVFREHHHSARLAIKAEDEVHLFEAGVFAHPSGVFGDRATGAASDLERRLDPARRGFHRPARRPQLSAQGQRALL